jgi:hypothetical protein
VLLQQRWVAASRYVAAATCGKQGHVAKTGKAELFGRVNVFVVTLLAVSRSGYVIIHMWL